MNMESNQKYSDTIRDMIKHEGVLLNHRFGWFLTSQSILFTAFIFALEKGHEIILLLVFIGLITNVSMFFMLRLPVLAQKNLEKRWEVRCTDDESLREVYPPVSGLSSRETHCIVNLLLPWNFLPLVFFVLWFSLGSIYIH